MALLRITPDGPDVAAGRQIVFQFDRPVVPVGRMERSADEISIDIAPSVQCQWRWINTSALACQLSEENALRPATRYTVRVAAGIRSTDGAVMTESVTHRFITQRPKIQHTLFQEWRAPGWPRIQLTFNQAVTRPAVEKHVRFVPAAGASKDYGLEVAPAENDRRPVLYAPFPGEPYGLIHPEFKSKRVDDRKGRHRGAEARRVWVVAPQRELPGDTDIRLTVEPGLVSALGPERGVKSRVVVEFRTYPQFRFVGIECTAAETRAAQLLAPDYRSGDALPRRSAAVCRSIRCRWYFPRP